MLIHCLCKTFDKNFLFLLSGIFFRLIKLKRRVSNSFHRNSVLFEPSMTKKIGYLILIRISCCLTTWFQSIFTLVLQTCSYVVISWIFLSSNNFFLLMLRFLILIQYTRNTNALKIQNICFF